MQLFSGEMRYMLMVFGPCIVVYTIHVVPELFDDKMIMLLPIT